MIVDPGQDADGLPGLFIASAAHVFYDLEKRRRFDRCRFHFRGLAQLPGYAADIDDSLFVAGSFDPSADASDPGQGSGDWALIYVSVNPGVLRSARPLPFPGSKWSIAEDEDAFYLVAWNAGRQRIEVTGPCRATLSTTADIGGGAWPGHWLDGCPDEGPGASGGGLVSVHPEGLVLVAIRTGEHWDGERYPDGPPGDVTWNPAYNSKAARGVVGAPRAAMEKLVEQVRNKRMGQSSPTFP